MFKTLRICEYNNYHSQSYIKASVRKFGQHIPQHPAFTKSLLAVKDTKD